MGKSVPLVFTSFLYRQCWRSVLEEYLLVIITGSDVRKLLGLGSIQALSLCLLETRQYNRIINI